MFKFKVIKALRIVMGVSTTLMGVCFTYIVATTPAK